MEVVVIGAGASGILAALKASENHKVTLLEGNDKIGKKILLTGNGKCNYWNQEIDETKYNTDDLSHLKEIISKENQEEVLAFLSHLGIYPKIKNGYYYPYSNQASSIREIFEKALEKRNVNILTNCKVKNIKKINDEFMIQTEKKEIHAKKIILATGSKAFPKTGSEGIGYDIASSLSLNVNPITPSLVGLTANMPHLKDWEGVRTDSTLTLYIDGKKRKEETGEIQLTNYGISGICTFNISGIASKNLHLNHKVEVTINFLPDLPLPFKIWFQNRSNELKQYSIEETLESILNYKLMFVICKMANIDKEKSWNELSNKEKENLEKYIAAFPLTITDTLLFDRAQVCTGGISLKEINPENMETKIEGLSIVGEVLDVDGICGGYNLAFAFITGYLAGRKVK